MNTITNMSEGEQVKKEAIILREQGELERALEMFDEVIAWDEQNDDFRGKVDVLGHKRICLMLMAHKAEGAGRIDLLGSARECMEEAIKIAQEQNLPEGVKAVAYKHMSSVLYREGQVLGDRSKFEEALTLLEKAIANFTGSEAHLAWPLATKVELLVELKEYEKAEEIAFEALQHLSRGYGDEVEADDQFEVKLRIWLTGVWLALGKLYLSWDKEILGRMYLVSVRDTDDPEGILVAHKMEAEEMLK